MVVSSCPTENRQRRTDAARAVPQSEAKSKSQSREFRKKIEPPQSQLAQETMRSKIRRMKMEKTFGEQGTLSQAVVKIVNEAARDQEGSGDARRKPNTAEEKETSRAKSILHEESNQIATVLNSIHQLKIQEAEAHKRSTSMSPTVSTQTVKIKEARDFSKSEAEMVDVMDTLQRAIPYVEKEMAKNLAFLQKEIDTQNTNNVTVALINSFQGTVLKRANHRRFTRKQSSPRCDRPVPSEAWHSDDELKMLTIPLT